MSGIGGDYGGGSTQRVVLAICIPDMVIGGVETVLITTLTELSHRPDIKIDVYSQAKITEPLYLNWFADHPTVRLRTIYPALHLFQNAQKFCRFFPLKQIRKLLFSLYKKYRRAIFQFDHADIFIDYKNMSLFKELRGISTPKITWVHGSFQHFQDHNYAQRMAEYDTVVALTDDFVAEFKQHYPDRAGKIVRIYNPIGVNDVRRRAENAPSFTGAYFCAVARMDAGKDHKTIIDAFNTFIQNTGADVNLLIVGAGPTLGAMQSYAAATPAANRIVFTGAAPNPFGYMRGALAHILSSYSEGMGMVLIEAAALNTPNIASDCKNGPREILMNGEAGLLFNIGDADALARHMTDIYRGNIDVQAMTTRANNSLDRFATKNIAEQICALVQKTLKDRQCQ